MHKRQTIIGEPQAISGLIEYQKDSVVSKAIIEKTHGSITIFAFDEGQGLSEHTAPFDALVEIIDGEAEISIAGKAHRVTAGQFIIMPANKPHALRATSRFKMLLVLIKK